MRRAEREKGFALIGALMIALLLLILMSVLLTDLTRVTRSAATGRSRVVAEALAESGAELAARHMMLGLQSNFRQKLPEGEFEASWNRFATTLPDVWRFEIRVRARSTTVPPYEANLTIAGIHQGDTLRIQRTEHGSSASGVAPPQPER